MNNKLIYIFLVLMGMILPVNAQQVNFNSWSNNYLGITSYNGNNDSNAYTLVLSGNGVINVPDWKISVKLLSLITSGTYTFPANKISFQPVSTSGQADPSPIPTIQQIGMPLNVVLQENTEMFLVPQSNTPLYNNPQTPNGYYDLRIQFRLTVEGGAYLGNYPSNTKFYPNLEFTVYDQYNNVIGKRQHQYTIHIQQLSGTPPVTPQFSIKIASNAVNGLLELKTRQDYIQGASVTYPSGVIVSANTDYQVKVTSLQPVFTSATGNMLPLSTVRLNLIPEAGNQGTVFPVSLSNASQKIASGANTNGQVSYSITYATQPNDINLITGKMEQYSTTLQYEILPK